MATNTRPYTRKFYLDRLIGAGTEIILRADDMLGEIDGVQSIKVSFEIDCEKIIVISVNKTYISEYKQPKEES